MENMKRNNFINLLGYKLNLFVTWEFSVLSFLTLVCVVILLLYAFDIQMYVDLDNKICNNLNSILLSITSGYIVSYFVYLLTAYIPNYDQALVNDRIICNHLSLYRDNLLYSFGGLVYIYKKKYLKDVIDIPTITKLFDSEEYKDKTIVRIIQSTYNSNSKEDDLLLVKQFERLEDSFRNLLSLNAFYKGRFSHEIYQLQISEWANILYIIKSEIQYPLDGSSILEIPNTRLLINKNFCLANKAANVNALINSKSPRLSDLYKLLKTFIQKHLKINKSYK